MISGNFPRDEIKLFQTDVDKCWNSFIWHVTTALGSSVVTRWLFSMINQYWHSVWWASLGFYVSQVTRWHT